jgi:hypothetical protein
MFDTYFQNNEPLIKNVFAKRNSINELIETENLHSTGVILHIGAQRTSTTMMQAWLWPLVLNAIYLGREYNYRGNGQFDYIRLPIPVMIRDNFLGKRKIPSDIFEKIVSDLFITSKTLRKKVVFSIEIMEISALGKIIQLLRSLQDNREETGVDFKIICTIREPVDMMRSMFALDCFLKGRIDQSLGFENWFYQFLDSERSDLDSLSFKTNADVQDLLNRHEKYYTDGVGNPFPFFLENARWDLWSRIMSTVCGAERVHFIPMPGRLESWKVFSDILHGEIHTSLKDQIDDYYDELFKTRPHLNAFLATDAISPERRDYEKLKVVLNKGVGLFDQALGGARREMLDHYYEDTRVFMRSLEKVGN